MEIKILGICGSPIKGGNVEVFLAEALKAAAEEHEVKAETITLAHKNIKDCIHCNWCVMKQTEDKLCAQGDDMVEIYPKILEADGFLFATPVYNLRLSGYLANFFDRWRCLVEARLFRGKAALKNKVAGALAVSWFRNQGPETALLSIYLNLIGMEIIPVGLPLGTGSPCGAVGLSSEGGTGVFKREVKLGVLKDEWGLESARLLGRRVIQMIKLVKAGQKVIEGKIK
jgi:multimeric flavodoxin WrbA